MISIIEDISNILTHRELRVLSLRSEELTLDEIGKEFGVTRERIRQIEKKALFKLSNPEIVKKFKKDIFIIKNYLHAPTNLEQLSLKLNENHEVQPNIETWELNLGLNIFNIICSYGLENENIHFVSDKFNSLNESRKNFVNFNNNCFIFSIEKFKHLSFKEIINFLNNNFIFTEEILFKKFNINEEDQFDFIDILEKLKLLKIISLPLWISAVTGVIFTSNLHNMNVANTVHIIIDKHFNEVYQSNANALKEDYFNCPNGIHIKKLVGNRNLRAVESSLERWIKNNDYGLIRNGNNNYGLKILNTNQKNKITSKDNLELIIETLESEGPCSLHNLINKIWDKNPDFFISSLQSIISTESNIFRTDENKNIHLRDGYDNKTENIPSGQIVEMIKSVLYENSPLSSHQITNKLNEKNIFINNSVVTATLRSRNLTFKKVDILSSDIQLNQKNNKDLLESLKSEFSDSSKKRGNENYAFREILKSYDIEIDSKKLQSRKVLLDLIPENLLSSVKRDFEKVTNVNGGWIDKGRVNHETNNIPYTHDDKFEKSTFDNKTNFYELVENSKKIEGYLDPIQLKKIIEYYLSLLNQVNLKKIKSPSSLVVSEKLISQEIFLESNQTDLRFRQISVSLLKLGYTNYLENYSPSSVSENKIITEILKKILSS